MQRPLAPTAYYLGVTLFLSILLATVTADENDGFIIYGQWLIQVGGPMLTLVLGQFIITQRNWFPGGNPWLKLALGGLIGGILFSPFALMLDLGMGEEPFPGWEAGPLLQLWLGELSGVLPPVTLSWVALNVPLLLGLNFSLPKGETEPSDQVIENIQPASPTEPTLPENDMEPDKPGFWDRLPPELGRDVICMSSELHYLRVSTTQGEALILCALKDALAELPADWGKQTHRSWAVARAHVQGLTKRRDQTVLQLTNDLLAPVSRRRIAETKAWLQTASKEVPSG